MPKFEAGRALGGGLINLPKVDTPPTSAPKMLDVPKAEIFGMQTKTVEQLKAMFPQLDSKSIDSNSPGRNNSITASNYGRLGIDLNKISKISGGKEYIVTTKPISLGGITIPSGSSISGSNTIGLNTKPIYDFHINAEITIRTPDGASISFAESQNRKTGEAELTITAKKGDKQFEPIAMRGAIVVNAETGNLGVVVATDGNKSKPNYAPTLKDFLSPEQFKKLEDVFR